MTAAVSRTATRPGRSTGQRRATRPALEVLDQVAVRQRARRRNALLTLFIVVLVGFFAVAFVHAQLVAGQQDLDALRARIAKAETRNAQLARSAEEASAPHAIVSRAAELGMVRAHEPVYLVAAAPLREVPTAAVLPVGSGTATFELAAAPAGAEPSIAIGDSADVVLDKVAADRRAEVAAAAEAERESEREATPAPPPSEATEAAMGPAGSLGGTTVTFSGRTATTMGDGGAVAASDASSSVSSAVASSAAGPSPQVTTPAVGGVTVEPVATSIAGSRAVSGGLGGG